MVLKTIIGSQFHSKNNFKIYGKRIVRSWDRRSCYVSFLQRTENLNIYQLVIFLTNFRVYRRDQQTGQWFELLAPQRFL